MPLYAQAGDEPARVQCCYERAVAAFPVTTELWMQYGRYIETHLRSIPGLVASVYDRALRNCYWVGALWARAIRAAARGGGGPSSAAAAGSKGGDTPPSEASLKQQAELYERAMRAGLQVRGGACSGPALSPTGPTNILQIPHLGRPLTPTLRNLDLASLSRTA